MSSKSNTSPSMTQSLGLLLARVPLGLYLVLVGYQHFSGGLAHFADAHSGALSRWVPSAVASGLLKSVPILELAAGAFLVLGIFSRTGGLLAVLALVTLLASVGNLHGTDGMPFNPLVILAGFAVYLGLAGSGGLSLDRLVWGSGKHA